MINPDDPAFPHDELDPNGQRRQWFGLTIRQEFAKAAMQGLLANPGWEGSFVNVADDAVKYADALILELNKKEDGK